MYIKNFDETKTEGQFVTVNQERFYCIKNVDQMAPFFISVISDNDHWLFISSNGALSAGRESPETSLFPYECSDKLTDDYLNTGSKTILRITKGDKLVKWEPFNQEQNGIYAVQRNLYKNTLGNKISFEETNSDLQLTFKYTWEMSDKYGFVRRSEILNHGDISVEVEILDGLQNLLPAGTPRFTQTVSSNLVDAYKWTERLEGSTLGVYSLYSGITDRAEPCESLRANTVFSVGLENPKVLLSTEQIGGFKNGQTLEEESTKRGIRGAYFVNQKMVIAQNDKAQWSIVANLEQTQGEVSALKAEITETSSIIASINESIKAGDQNLAALMASVDGFQATNEENVSVHHYANTLFNALRGGVFNDQYTISSRDLCQTVALFNKAVFLKHETFLESLPDRISMSSLQQKTAALNDPQLLRLVTEYLPIFFGRRHGDPSRPWNQFAIKLHDENKQALLTYQGNWRDIFQNWEALSFSYPEYIEGIIAKFVNASTIDGYNPYRITKEGIDWEVEEPDDPWSYIGYWGDHQIIYLLKMLEMSTNFHPARLRSMLENELYCYANVPYRIKAFDDILVNAKDTVTFDEELAQLIEQRVQSIGSDGKLLLNSDNSVYLVNLLEKLLVPLLSKLGNLVVDGGIWLNTQRPEWNDANNALVGQGLSMVTLNYLRRYINFMQQLLAQQNGDVSVSKEVSVWLEKTLGVLLELGPHLNGEPIDAQMRFEVIHRLGQAASDYRLTVYNQHGFSGRNKVAYQTIEQLLSSAQQAIEHTISVSKGDDGLYQAYNLLEINDTGGTKQANVNYLYPMLEGQVACLSSGVLSFEEVVSVTNTLFASDVYRADQHTFMLYPDRKQTTFMQKNVVLPADLERLNSLVSMVENNDSYIVSKSLDGIYRFNSELTNKNALEARLQKLANTYPTIAHEKQAIMDLYEKTFDHQSFTGRSGGMFGFEGLGSIYWHMVSKMLLALAENFAQASKQNADADTVQQLGNLYYKVRDGIGFNKTPQEYGAFPTDPYSHTPKHAGAQQPGMTGQVKEELISRFTELGISVSEGAVEISPNLLREQEFITHQRDFWYLDVNNEWQKLVLDPGCLAFTWCQVPFIYQLSDSANFTTLYDCDEKQERSDILGLNAQQANELFKRSGKYTKITVSIKPNNLFVGE